MTCITIRMLISSHIPTLAAVFFLLGPSMTYQMTSNQRRRINTRKLYKQYKGILKEANMTSFPEGDIRNLLIEGHEFSKKKERKLILSKPEVTTTHIASTHLATVSRSHRKKSGRKGRNPPHEIITPIGSLWQKKFYSMRREETEKLIGAESNELESQSTNAQSAEKNRKKSQRKDRAKERRKYQRPVARPIKGQKALSLNIARLKERCKTKPMKQEIRVKGCSSKYIMNNLCYGQCNSFYIPEIRGRGNGPPSFTSCAFCRPRVVRPVYVTLQCTSKRGRTRLKRKKVSYVKKCRCMELEIDIKKW